VCDPRMVDLMRRTAQRYSIPHQMEILPRGGTDTAAMQRFGQGAITGCISIPSRYVHSVIEMISEHDLAAAVDLLVAVVADAHTLLA
ncbi:MAG: M20/M25/M40 family metallo-hydrolase, partial [Verrucomicrobiota bacterium]|nr:M20/M25/M40 family metallo-hydrolase [Verrucomicrobiota bacterium]